MKVVAPDKAGIARAAQAIAAGEIVAYPTETVYGLAVNPFSEAAVDRLLKVKGRGPDTAILVIVADDIQLEQVAAEITPAARQFMEAFWPGPLSLLFKKSHVLAPSLTRHFEKVCVRCPGLDMARELCKASKLPLTSTSANRSGETPASAVGDIRLDGISVAIDGGVLPPSPPSTIYDPDTDRIIREGAISREAIAKVKQRLT